MRTLARQAIRLALGAVVLATPALADSTPSLTASGGQWLRVFTGDIEQILGRRVLVDASTLTTTGTSRTFRQAELLLRADSGIPQGATVYMARTVDCQQSLVATTAWTVLAAGGAVLGSGTGGTQVTQIHWDTRDGKVLRYVCTGIQPR